MLESALNKKRIVGLAILAILLTLFLLFNRIPKLDTVRADLDGVSSPTAECFQGFCIEADGDSSMLSKWWSFSATYMRLVAAGPTSEVFTPENLRKTYGGKLALLDQVGHRMTLSGDE